MRECCSTWIQYANQEHPDVFQDQNSWATAKPKSNWGRRRDYFVRASVFLMYVSPGVTGLCKLRWSLWSERKSVNAEFLLCTTLYMHHSVYACIHRRFRKKSRDQIFYFKTSSLCTLLLLANQMTGRVTGIWDVAEAVLYIQIVAKNERKTRCLDNILWLKVAMVHLLTCAALLVNLVNLYIYISLIPVTFSCICLFCLLCLLCLTSWSHCPS